MVTVTTYRAVWWHGDRTEGFPTTYNCTSKRVCIRWRTVYQSDLCSIIKLKWVKAAHGPRTHANWRRSSYSASNKFAKYYSCTFAVLNSQYVATHVGAYSCCLHALKLDQCMYRRQRDHLNGLLFYIVYRCVVLSIMISVMIFFPRTIVILTSTQKHTRVLYWNNQYLSLVYEISNSKSVNTAYNIPLCASKLQITTMTTLICCCFRWRPSRPCFLLMAAWRNVSLRSLGPSFPRQRSCGSSDNVAEFVSAGAWMFCNLDPKAKD